MVMSHALACIYITRKVVASAWCGDENNIIFELWFTGLEIRIDYPLIAIHPYKCGMYVEY